MKELTVTKSNEKILLSIIWTILQQNQITVKPETTIIRVQDGKLTFSISDQTTKK